MVNVGHRCRRVVYSACSLQLLFSNYDTSKWLYLRYYCGTGQYYKP